MTLSSQTPLIRKPLRRAYTTIRTLDRIKENQGILRTSQRWNWVPQEVTDQGLSRYSSRTQPRSRLVPTFGSEPPQPLSMDPSELPQTSDCVGLPLMYLKVFKVNTPNGSTDCSYQVSVPSSYIGIICGRVADNVPF